MVIIKDWGHFHLVRFYNKYITHIVLIKKKISFLYLECILDYLQKNIKMRTLMESFLWGWVLSAEYMKHRVAIVKIVIWWLKNLTQLEGYSLSSWSFWWWVIIIELVIGLGFQLALYIVLVLRTRARGIQYGSLPWAQQIYSNRWQSRRCAPTLF